MLKEGYAVWQCGDHELSLTRPRIMGILNVTPDSFSDGGADASFLSLRIKNRLVAPSGSTRLGPPQFVCET